MRAVPSGGGCAPSLSFAAEHEESVKIQKECSVQDYRLVPPVLRLAGHYPPRAAAPRPAQTAPAQVS